MSLINILIIIILLSLSFYVGSWLKIPRLILYLLVGIFASAYQFNLVPVFFYNFSDLIRNLALVVILLRSGLGLNTRMFKKGNKAVYLLSTIPALLESLFVFLVSYFVFKLPLQAALLLGFMLAAVSPAVIVPKMLEIIAYQDERMDDAKIILAASSFDDILSMSLFFIVLTDFNNLNFSFLLLIPLKIVFSIMLALSINRILNFFKLTRTWSLILLVMLAYGLQVSNVFFAIPLLTIVLLGLFFKESHPQIAHYIEAKLHKFWLVLEVLLFFMIGSLVDLSAMVSVLSLGIVVIVLGLLGRFIGVMISTRDLKSDKRFYLISALPKATVQASLASLPLLYNVQSADTLLAVSVLSILITAPIGAVLISYYDFKFRQRKSFH